MIGLNKQKNIVEYIFLNNFQFFGESSIIMMLGETSPEFLQNKKFELFKRNQGGLASLIHIYYM